MSLEAPKIRVELDVRAFTAAAAEMQRQWERHEVAGRRRGTLRGRTILTCASTLRRISNTLIRTGSSLATTADRICARGGVAR